MRGFKLSGDAKGELMTEMEENQRALENKPRSARYPWDFTKFEGAELSDEKIDYMLAQMLASENTLSTYTGNTKIVLKSWGDIHIWKHTATYHSRKRSKYGDENGQ